MSYNGFEIDMLNLGDADSILVTSWTNGTPTRTLVDGGNKSDAERILTFLKGLGVSHLNHIVCSHPHADHTAGLVEVVKSNKITFDNAWMHLPWNHVNFPVLAEALRRGESNAKRVVTVIRASLATGKELYDAIQAHGITPREPFEGTDIGLLKVCGPSQQYYEELLQEFTDFEKLKKMEEAMASYDKHLLYERVLVGKATLQNLLAKSEGELGTHPTEPENNSSTILATVYEGKKLLLTADAGVEALTRAKNAYQLDNLYWMQIPHHGSRRNINKELIAYFKPSYAFVSAVGNEKHPRRAVVNAFKEVGTSVHSTHWPTPAGNDKRFPVGDVPARPNYSASPPLYEESSNN